MTKRLALVLGLIVAAGCAEKLTGPEARAAAREYQVKPISAEQIPLILLNGNEVSADSLRRFPTDLIESVEVVKGPKSVERYGARATNGVILVVTKR